MPWFIIGFLILGFVLSSQPVVASDGSLDVTVVDGDTLEVGGKTIRLYGIDAPELGQFCLNGTKRYRCGFEAALMLKKLVAGRSVDCQPTPVDADDNGQICSVGLDDLALAILRHGYAVAQPSAIPIYRKVEGEAKQSRFGIWRGEFILPSDWRAGHRLPTDADVPKQICDIKGIVSDGGKKVYLVPSDHEYGDIDLDRSRGEQFFCSDDQAEFAGWRRWPKSAVRQRTIIRDKGSN